MRYSEGFFGLSPALVDSEFGLVDTGLNKGLRAEERSGPVKAP
jgi:hypothetical protein